MSYRHVPRYAQAFLSQPAARGHRWAAAWVAGLALLVTVLAMQHAAQPWGTRQAFPVVVTVVLVMGYAFTSFLLAVQADQLRHPTLAILAGTYGFMAIMYCIYLTMRPGVVAEQGLFGATPQSALWVTVVARCIFPLGILLATLQIHQSSRRFTLAGAWLVPIFSAPLTAAAVIAAVTALPVLLVDNDFSPALLGLITPVQSALYVGVLLTLIAVSRLRTRLHLWLAVVLFIMVAEALLGASGGARFTAGWYIARALSLVSSLVLAVAVLCDIRDMCTMLQRINADLHEDSIKDGLTGLFQRRYFDRFLERVGAEQAGKELAIVLLDIDRFKLYNDRFGHPMGDACLMAVCKTITDCVPYDEAFVARYGGEELAVVLLGECALRVATVAETIRKRVEDINLQHAPEAHQPWITVSGGWARGASNGDTNTMIHRADVALYRAKNSGRNRVFGDDTPDQSGVHAGASPKADIAER